MNELKRFVIKRQMVGDIGFAVYIQDRKLEILEKLIYCNICDYFSTFMCRLVGSDEQYKKKIYTQRQDRVKMEFKNHRAWNEIMNLVEGLMNPILERMEKEGRCKNVMTSDEAYSIREHLKIKIKDLNRKFEIMKDLED